MFHWQVASATYEIIHDIALIMEQACVEQSIAAQVCMEQNILFKEAMHIRYYVKMAFIKPINIYRVQK